MDSLSALLEASNSGNSDANVHSGIFSICKNERLYIVDTVTALNRSKALQIAVVRVGFTWHPGQVLQPSKQRFSRSG